MEWSESYGFKFNETWHPHSLGQSMRWYWKSAMLLMKCTHGLYMGYRPFTDNNRHIVPIRSMSSLRMLFMSPKIFRKLIHHFLIWWAHHTPWQSEALLYPWTTMVDHGQQTSTIPWLTIVHQSMTMAHHVWPWSNIQWPRLTRVNRGQLMTIVDHGHWPWWMVVFDGWPW